MKKIKKLRKSQPTFWHYVKKIEAQAKKNGFLIREKNVYLEMVQTFQVEPNPGEIIIGHYLLMTPGSDNTSSDISLCFK